MIEHEELIEEGALVLWRCLYTEDDRDCDGTYFLPPVFVLAPHEDEAWNRSSPLVVVPEGCYVTGCYEARPATEDEAQEWMTTLATLPTPPVAGEPEREALAVTVRLAMGCERRAHYGNVQQPYCGTHGGYGIWPCRESQAVADAVFAAWPGREHEPREAEIVCLCGSTRFHAEIAVANCYLTSVGSIVLAPGVFGHDGDLVTEAEKVDLDRLHLKKIDLAGRVHVVNPGGYIGESTRREIDYALSLGKHVTYMIEPVTPSTEQQA